MTIQITTIPNSSDPSIRFVNLSRCNRLTYPQWAFVVSLLLKAFDLFKFVDGSHPRPPPTLTENDGDKTIEKTNPLADYWTRQDKLLSGELVCTLDTTVVSLVTHTTSSHELWTVLLNFFGKQLRARLLQIKTRHQSIKKWTPYPIRNNNRHICQYCGYIGHTFANCRNFKKNNPDVVIIPYNRYQWIVDSGASCHVTYDLNNLAYCTPYNGDGIIIGDDSVVPIPSVGCFRSLNLSFPKVFHAPLMSKNILSVSQFCRDNNAVIVLSYDSFCFKDCSTGRTLLKGTIEDGMYVATLPPSSAYTATASNLLV